MLDDVPLGPKLLVLFELLGASLGSSELFRLQLKSAISSLILPLFRCVAVHARKDLLRKAPRGVGLLRALVQSTREVLGFEAISLYLHVLVTHSVVLVLDLSVKLCCQGLLLALPLVCLRLLESFKLKPSLRLDLLPEFGGVFVASQGWHTRGEGGMSLPIEVWSLFDVQLP